MGILPTEKLAQSLLISPVDFIQNLIRNMILKKLFLSLISATAFSVPALASECFDIGREYAEEIAMDVCGDPNPGCTGAGCFQLQAMQVADVLPPPPPECDEDGYLGCKATLIQRIESYCPQEIQHFSLFEKRWIARTVCKEASS